MYCKGLSQGSESWAHSPATGRCYLCVLSWSLIPQSEQAGKDRGCEGEEGKDRWEPARLEPRGQAGSQRSLLASEFGGGGHGPAGAASILHHTV